MGLDIRFPIGLMFTLIGTVLAIFGVLSDTQIYQRSLGHNVNLWWGLVLLVFGLVFLYYGQRATKALQTKQPSPGAVEERPAVPHGH